jgi:hypothetical protein
MLTKALARSTIKLPFFRFSSHLVKSDDLNPDPTNKATVGSKHYNKDFYSNVLDFDHENEDFVEMHYY